MHEKGWKDVMVFLCDTVSNGYLSGYPDELSVNRQLS